ncbi:MAG: LysE family transporter [Thermoanaerobaculia bacterium]|nr:LysE family transporter [Thermoanaerobaculia bacterium]
MTATLLVALVLGCFAGLAPGPYTTMVVATAIERGFRPALRLAFTPFVTDVAPLVVTSLALDRMSASALSGIGALGGLVVIAIGVRLLSRHLAEPLDPGTAAPPTVRFWHAAVSQLLSPAPWLFWLLVGSPLFLRAWKRSQVEGGLFLAVLFLTNVGTASALAWGGSHGARLLSRRWRTVALRVAGGVLIGGGALLCWNALFGDPQALIDSQNELKEMVRGAAR